MWWHEEYLNGVLMAGVQVCLLSGHGLRTARIVFSCCVMRKWSNCMVCTNNVQNCIHLSILAWDFSYFTDCMLVTWADKPKSLLNQGY